MFTESFLHARYLTCVLSHLILSFLNGKKQRLPHMKSLFQGHLAELVFRLDSLHNHGS